MTAETSRAVLVTGCSTGIGRATAAMLARSGWPVYATARNIASLDGLTDLGCRALQLDVTEEDSIRAAVDAVADEHGAVGVLVNNAGYSQSGAVETVPLAQARRQFETNFFGPARLTQLVLPGMRAQRWGKVVNLSSMGGRLTFPGGGYYHATKYALEALSDALRFEVAGFGIDVVLIEPGFIRTDFSHTAASSLDGPATAGDASTADPYRSFRAGVLASTRDVYDRGLMARLGGTPDDVARVVLEAVTASRPKTRYPVTPSSRVLLGVRRLVPDRAWDALLARKFVRPGAGDG
ncbi:MAG: Short-chain dehydrogenase/reductase SDR [uncultured Acidimicrobiales bacterium]|uniref:Short-chain dehydrogenase/reductase SDR n=1 Tax=uncultured Acidimicrobiales bacterium TaxID=310071 RepID=A0A6J4JD61_9ACTN|nr:MAG: Short-chain dehydrogenase/reductase SDR [uncultured Acidimicrobiales bacterium]